MIFQIVSVVFVVVTCWCIGGLIELGILSRHYNENIDSPWQNAIETKDWETCDKLHDIAQRHISNMSAYIWNPLKWFKVPE